MDTHLRSILKASTWRAGGTLVTFIISLLVVEKIDLAAKIGFLDTLIKILAYYAHERIALLRKSLTGGLTRKKRNATGPKSYFQKAEKRL